MAMIERWRPETHTFHLPLGEVTLTLQDVQVLFGLRVEENLVVFLNLIHRNSDWAMMLQVHTGFTPAPDNFTGTSYLNIGVLIEYIWQQIWTWERVLPFQPSSVGEIDEDEPLMSYGRKWMRDKMLKRDTEVHHALVPMSDQLDCLTSEQFMWTPYCDILHTLPPCCISGQVMRRMRVPMLCLKFIEWHPADRVMRQFNLLQHIPEAPLWQANHAKCDDQSPVNQGGCGRGRGRGRGYGVFIHEGVGDVSLLLVPEPEAEAAADDDPVGHHDQVHSPPFHPSPFMPGCSSLPESHNFLSYIAPAWVDEPNPQSYCDMPSRDLICTLRLSFDSTKFGDMAILDLAAFVVQDTFHGPMNVTEETQAWLNVFVKVNPFLEELRLKRMDVSDESLEFLEKSFHGFKVGEYEFGYILADILKESNVNSDGMHFDTGARTTFTFVRVDGDDNEVEAPKIAHSVASSLLVKADVYGRDSNWG
ncbi:hypothetical protein T459_01590 [Capsicum annuum]|uniref:Aminotransferase-like plant mobile domain-containing protein n=1 Tax=Capsicum annuum TaxID=4072 RepID=A0A2G3AHP4_CAPAN|nr:hypothetical protein T459_01590 [Capsicum annuum]